MNNQLLEQAIGEIIGCFNSEEVIEQVGIFVEAEGLAWGFVEDLNWEAEMMDEQGEPALATLCRFGAQRINELEG
jgi:hypothetical protein